MYRMRFRAELQIRRREEKMCLFYNSRVHVLGFITHQTVFVVFWRDAIHNDLVSRRTHGDHSDDGSAGCLADRRLQFGIFLNIWEIGNKCAAAG